MRCTTLFRHPFYEIGRDPTAHGSRIGAIDCDAHGLSLIDLVGVTQDAGDPSVS